MLGYLLRSDSTQANMEINMLNFDRLTYKNSTWKFEDTWEDTT